MAVVVFYEKPGCSGNAWQKTLLEASGHTVVARNLFKLPWSRMQLRSFLDKLPIAQWFNPHAPMVKSGGIVPAEFDSLDEEVVLGLFQADPLLIRRPLLEVDGVRRAGFDVQAIHEWIGLSAAFDHASGQGNPETCQYGSGREESCSGHD